MPTIVSTEPQRETWLLASTQLAQAAGVISAEPAALQLRYLQTLTEIAVEKNSIIVFPLPMDLITPLMHTMHHQCEVSVPEPLNGARSLEHAQSL